MAGEKKGRSTDGKNAPLPYAIGRDGLCGLRRAARRHTPDDTGPAIRHAYAGPYAHSRSLARFLLREGGSLHGGGQSWRYKAPSLGVFIEKAYQRGLRQLVLYRAYLLPGYAEHNRRTTR